MANLVVGLCIITVVSTISQWVAWLRYRTEKARSAEATERYEMRLASVRSELVTARAATAAIERKAIELNDKLSNLRSLIESVRTAQGLVNAYAESIQQDTDVWQDEAEVARMDEVPE